MNIIEALKLGGDIRRKSNHLCVIKKNYIDGNYVLLDFSPLLCIDYECVEESDIVADDWEKISFYEQKDVSSSNHFKLKRQRGMRSYQGGKA